MSKNDDTAVIRTDTERIEFLEKLNQAGTYTGKCILRMSNTGRGWRLHEHSEGGFCTVRGAIDAYMDEHEHKDLISIDEELPNEPCADTKQG